MSATDDQLMERAARGEAEAFGPLIDRHGPALFRYLLRLTGSAAVAEDLLQETLVAAFAARRRYEPGRSLRAWLVTIARHRAWNELRGRARTLVDSETVAAELHRLPVRRLEPQQEALRLELRAEIIAALQALPPLRREAVVLRDVEGFSYREVAQALGTTEPAARVRVHRAREQLQRLLSAYLGEDTPRGARR